MRLPVPRTGGQCHQRQSRELGWSAQLRADHPAPMLEAGSGQLHASMRTAMPSATPPIASRDVGAHNLGQSPRKRLNDFFCIVIYLTYDIAG